MPNYIGVTIGPISKTIQSAKKMREIWVASYIFSYIMREIIKEFRERNILLPYVDKNDDSMFNEKNKVGIFPDRFIFESKEGDFEKLGEVVDNILGKLANEFNESKEKLKRYFQIYYFEKSYDNSKKSEIITDVTEILDGLELRTQFIKKDFSLVPSISYLYDKFLLNDAGFKKRFPSIAEIAAVEFDDIKDFESDKDEVEDDEVYDIIKKIFKMKKFFRKPHKYIAIVYYDGDNFSKTIKSLGDNTITFSKYVYEFSKKAVKLIRDYEGLPIYASGDDGFFFAPVKNRDKNIFDLIRDIKKVFDDTFKKDFKDVSISFGISITYHKYPMNEAVEQSKMLLFDVAKEFNNGAKNAVAFKILKHSGHYFEGVFDQSSEEYCKFLEILNSSNEKFLSSLIFKMDNLRGLLSAVGADKEKIENIYENFFNESIHKENIAQINKIKDYYISVMNSKNYSDNETKLNLFYSSLRYNKFLGESL